MDDITTRCNGEWLDNVVFCLERNEDNNELFVIQFGDNYSVEGKEIPVEESLEWFRKHLNIRLQEIKNTLKNR